MKKTILICGHGPGISDAVARKFGAEGFAVALAARSADKLDAAVKALGAKGITAAAFPTDLGNLQAVKQLVSSVHAKLGPLNVLHWNAYAFGAGDIAADPAELQNSLNVSATGLWTAVQAAHGDLKEQKGAVLVTGGAPLLLRPPGGRHGRRIRRSRPGGQQGGAAQADGPSQRKPRQRGDLRR